MTTIKFEYKPWDPRVDVRLMRPGNEIGVAAVKVGFQVSKVPTVRIGRRDPTINTTLEGVIGLLAGALEWCREYGLSAEDVRQRVRAYMANNRGSREQQVLLIAQAASHGVADPNNWFKDLSPAGKTILAGREPR